MRQRHLRSCIVTQESFGGKEVKIGVTSPAKDLQLSVVDVPRASDFRLLTSDLCLSLLRLAPIATFLLIRDSGREVDPWIDFPNRAFRNTHSSGFAAARLGDVARTRAVHFRRARVASFAVIGRHCRRLAQRFPAGFRRRFGAQDYMAAGNTVRMKPPVVRICETGTEIVVVTIRCSNKNNPLTRKFVSKNAWLAQYARPFEC